jgi:hypothetical protein
MGWYYAAGTDSVGPMSLQELTTVLRSFRDWKEIPLWREGFSDWKNAGDVAELFVGPPPAPKAKIVRPEIRTRRFSGWSFLILFFALTALMGWWFIDPMSRRSATPQATTEPDRAGQAIGKFTGQLSCTGKMTFPIKDSREDWTLAVAIDLHAKTATIGPYGIVSFGNSDGDTLEFIETSKVYSGSINRITGAMSAIIPAGTISTEAFLIFNGVCKPAQ